MMLFSYPDFDAQTSPMPNNTYRVEKLLWLRTSMMAVASCLVLSGLPLAGHAAGLGNIVVLSVLGQPLRAEIEVSATREELAGMKAKLAPPDAFKQANVDYTMSLLGIEFSLDRRPGGQPVIKLRSDKPINDPFVDVLLELDWQTGRLIREYTFLLDPPEFAAKTVAPVGLAKASAKQDQAGSSSFVTTRSTSASASVIDDDLRSKAVAKVRAQEPSQKAVDQPAEQRDLREVRRGDTLQKIASETKPEGVSLEQMLAGLWQANQEAFADGNMNRLKVGKTLSTPEKSTLVAISTTDARKIVAAQSADWNAYRRKLSAEAAREPTKEDVGQQNAAGKITPKVDDIAAPVAGSKDQVKISRAETVRARGNAKTKHSEEDRIAQDKALHETNDRLVSLEKNIANMQKLIELKDQQLAALQKQAVTGVATPETSGKPEHVASASPANSVPPPAVAEKSEELALSPQPPKPEVKPEPKPVIPQKTVQAPSLVEEFLGNPLALAGGALLVLFAGYFLYKRRKVANELTFSQITSE
jgi:pilus assembly protein FimV